MSWQKGLSQFEQIGNAVPPKVGQALGQCAIKILKQETLKLTASELSLTEPKQLSLFCNQSPEVDTKESDFKVGFNGTNRGRKSRFAHIYKEIEELKPNASFQISSDTPEEFFTFLKGAMRRRRIDYTLSRDTNGPMTITVKGKI